MMRRPPGWRELQREIARLQGQLMQSERLMRELLQQLHALKGAKMALVRTREKIRSRHRQKSKHGS